MRRFAVQRLGALLVVASLAGCDGLGLPQGSGGGASFVGSWSLATLSVDPTLVPEVTKPNLVLNDDGTWAWMELDGPIDTPNGIERGTYTSDATTLTLTITDDGIADPSVTPPENNGGMGNMGDVIVWTYSIANDQLSMSTTLANSSTLSFTATRTKVTGALDTNGSFTINSDPDVMVVYPNGKYFNWCDSTDTLNEVCDNIDVHNVELGTYTTSGTTVSIGTPDYDVGAHGLIDDNGMGVDMVMTFVDGDATTGAADIKTVGTLDGVTQFDITTTQLKDLTNPIVGAWHIGTDANFDPSTDDVLIFYPDGTYFEWFNVNNTPPVCAGVTDYAEIGTYTFDGSTLNITSHIQNGYGGFDDAVDCTQPAGALSATVSADGKTLTVSTYGVTLTRVE